MAPLAMTAKRPSLQIPSEFHSQIISTFGTTRVVASLIKVPYSTLTAWLRQGRWPEAKKKLFYQVQNYVQQSTTK
jgi:hypothetical protein